MTYTSLPTSNKPNTMSNRANSGISARLGGTLIRSGMQPNCQVNKILMDWM